MADPLKLLREFAISDRPIRELKQGGDNYIVFGEIAFRRSEKTNLMVYGKNFEYYSLESLVLLWQKKEMAHTAYVKEAAGLGIPPVTRPDRRELIDYLKGDREVPPSNVNITAPVPVPVQLTKLTDQEPESKKARYNDDLPTQKDKERIENLLSSQMSSTFLDKNTTLRDLTEDLTAEKIAALKSKAKAHKRTTIKSMDDGMSVQNEHEPLDSDQIQRELKRRQRVWLTRTTCLECPNFQKNFHKSVYGILQSVKAREQGGANGLDLASKSAGGVKTLNSQQLQPHHNQQQQQQQQQQAGYNRYDQEKFRREETAGFQIDTGLTLWGASLKAIREGAKPITAGGSETHGKMIEGVVANQETSTVRPKRISRTPIIVIPAAGTSLITMYNARDMLQDLRFVSTEDKKSQGVRRENELLLQRKKSDGITVPYRVIDNPLKLTVDEWDRVVAVFVQGPKWQFKDILGNAYFAKFFSSGQMDTKYVEKASEAYTKALELGGEKRNPDLYVNFSVVLKYEQCYSDSLSHLNTALRLDPNFEEAKEMHSNLISFLLRVDESVRKKGKVKTKRLMEMLKLLDSSKNLGPYSEGSIKLIDGSKIALNPVYLSSLKIGANSNSIVCATVIGIVHNEETVPYTFTVYDSNGSCMAVTVFNFALHFGMVIGDRFACPEPFVVNVDMNINDKKIAFKCIRVQSPEILVKNGTKLGRESVALTDAKFASILD